MYPVIHYQVEPGSVRYPWSCLCSSILATDGGRPTAPNVSTMDDTPALGAPATTTCTSWGERMTDTGVSRSDGAVCGSASGWSAGSRQPVPLAIASLPDAASSR